MTSAMLPPAPLGGPVDDTAIDDRELLSAKSGSGGFWRGVLRRLVRNPSAWVGAVIIAIFILISLINGGGGRVKGGGHRGAHGKGKLPVLSAVPRAA